MSTSGYNNKKFIGGAGIQKELQGFAAFVAYQECHYRGYSASIATALEKSIGRQYFGVTGNDDFISLSEQLVKGIRVSGGLYNLEDATTGLFEPSDLAATQSVASAFHEQNQHDSVLLHKPELHCLGRHMQIAVGLSNNQITLPLCLQCGLSNNDHLAVRTLPF